MELKTGRKTFTTKEVLKYGTMLIDYANETERYLLIGYKGKFFDIDMRLGEVEGFGVYHSLKNVPFRNVLDNAITLPVTKRF